MDKYEPIRLKNQLCFPLYAVSNKIIRNYKPLLDKLDLTYTQYIVMMVLWEKEDINEKQLGEMVHLKSNTLTPLLKKLKGKGYISISKNSGDERNLVISLTKKGSELKDQAVSVPETLAKTLKLNTDEAAYLYRILYRILEDEE
ncbi:MAG: MarR family transcriptional regulator [Erysipelotrichaceae bacterium]|nr:MarR family transcriptional regulator [Erysipelotrichaceae bacterium]